MSLTGGQSLVITTSSILMLAVGAAVGRWRVVALPAGGLALFLLWVALDTPGTTESQKTGKRHTSSAHCLGPWLASLE